MLFFQFPHYVLTGDIAQGKLFKYKKVLTYFFLFKFKIHAHIFNFRLNRWLKNRKFSFYRLTFIQHLLPEENTTYIQDTSQDTKWNNNKANRTYGYGITTNEFILNKFNFANTLEFFPSVIQRIINIPMKYPCKHKSEYKYFMRNFFLN